MDPTNSILPFPCEIHFRVQKHLGRNDVVNYAGVSREYNEMVSGNKNLWKRLFSEITFPDKVNPKEYLENQAIGSVNQILERITQFAAKLEIGQEGTFICQLPHNLNCHFKLTLEHSLTFFREAPICSLAEPEKIESEKCEALSEQCILVNKIKENNANSRTSIIEPFEYKIRDFTPTIFQDQAQSSIRFAIDASLPDFEEESSLSLEKKIENIMRQEINIKLKNFYDRDRNRRIIEAIIVIAISLFIIRVTNLFDLS